MLARILLLLILLPIVEIVVLVWIATRTSVVFVLGLVIVMGLVGAWLLRHQSFRTMSRISSELDAGRMPAEPMVDGLFVVAAGVLMILPGVLSDVLAIALLLPPSRNVLKRILRRRMQSRVVAMYAAHGEAEPTRARVIDVRVVDNPPEEPL